MATRRSSDRELMSSSTRALFALALEASLGSLGADGDECVEVQSRRDIDTKCTAPIERLEAETHTDLQHLSLVPVSSSLIDTSHITAAF